MMKLDTYFIVQYADDIFKIKIAHNIVVTECLYMRKSLRLIKFS